MRPTPGEPSEPGAALNRRAPLTNEQLDQWLIDAGMFYFNSDPTGRMSSQVTRLIAELRASRAEALQYVEDWQAVARQRDELQRRIDKALAECRRHEPQTPWQRAKHLASHQATVVPTAAIRAALTATEIG